MARDEILYKASDVLDMPNILYMYMASCHESSTNGV